MLDSLCQYFTLYVTFVIYVCMYKSVYHKLSTQWFYWSIASYNRHNLSIPLKNIIFRFIRVVKCNEQISIHKDVNCFKLHSPLITNDVVACNMGILTRIFFLNCVTFHDNISGALDRFYKKQHPVWDDSCTRYMYHQTSSIIQKT